MWLTSRISETYLGCTRDSFAYSVSFPLATIILRTSADCIAATPRASHGRLISMLWDDVGPDKWLNVPRTLAPAASCFFYSLIRAQ
jgi:hypothetical protein